MLIDESALANPTNIGLKMQKELQVRLYERSQHWFNYFLDSPATSAAFKEALLTKDQLKFYRVEKNREKFPVENPEAPHIKTFVQQDIQLSIG